MHKADKLVEATMLALQGKLELKETKKAPKKAPKKTKKKTENIDINVDDKTTVAVDGNSTIVDTEYATVIVNKKEDILPAEAPIEEPIVDAPVAPSEEIVEIPADETIMPEDVVEEPVETELPEEHMEENKKIKTEGKLTFIENVDELPDICYGLLPSDNSIIVIKKNENGYYETDYAIPESREKAEELVADLNNKMGVTPDQRFTMELRSLSGNWSNKKVEGMQEDKNEEEIEDKKKANLLKRKSACRSPKIEAMRARRKNKKVDKKVEAEDRKTVKIDTTPDMEVMINHFREMVLEKPSNLGAVKFLMKYDKDFDKWAKENKLTFTTKREDKKVEDTEYELAPKYDGRKSFYGKARVVRKDNGDEELHSYGTHVGGVRNGKPYSKGTFSQTTSRHQKEFFKQRGIDPKSVEVEESKKVEAKECKDKECKCIKELGICEGTPKTEEPVPSTKTEIVEKFNRKSFTEALNKYYAKNKFVKDIKVNKVTKTEGKLKIDATLKTIKNQSRCVCLEMKQAYAGKSFNRYTLLENKRNKKTENAKEMTLMTRNKNGVVECIYVEKK